MPEGCRLKDKSTRQVTLLPFTGHHSPLCSIPAWFLTPRTTPPGQASLPRGQLLPPFPCPDRFTPALGIKKPGTA